MAAQRPGTLRNFIRRVTSLNSLGDDVAAYRNAQLERRFLELTQFMYNGSGFIAGLNQTNPGQETERLEHSFVSYVYGGLKANGAVATCIQARVRVFSQLRFLFQEFNDGRPGDMFDSQALLPLRRPWTGAGTRQLLTWMLLHNDLGGNAYVLRPKTPDDMPMNRLAMLRPDWVTIVIAGDPDDPLAEVLGYLYQPGGPGSSKDAVFYDASEVAHFAALPDPYAKWRGMSWLTPVIRNLQAHQAATEHKIGYFERGATPNMVVKFDPLVSQESVNVFKDMFNETQVGASNAGRPLFLGGGADVTMVGSTLQQMSFAETQDAEEALIAAAAGVPLAIAQLGEGLQGSTLNAGNVEAVKRIFQETTIADLAGCAAEALAGIVRAPRSDVRLWWDVRDVPFFRADATAAADVRAADAATIRSLSDGGFDPDSARDAVVANDFALLKHTGQLSVQLQEPGTAETSATVEDDPDGEGQEPEGTENDD